MGRSGGRRPRRTVAPRAAAGGPPRGTGAGPGPAAFTPLYELPDEWAGELVNRTMHGVLHLGWVPDGASGHRGQMAVLVRPEGRLGALYMAAIRPFRHRLVYPGLLRTIERRWREGASAPR